MPSKFANAVDCVPEPCAVLGTQLQPFCLGHHLLFGRMEVDPYSLATDDFLMAVFICAYSYDDTVAGLLAGEWNDRYQRWLTKAKRLLKRDKGAVERFFRYLKTGYDKPPVWQHGQSKHATEFSAPWELLLRNRLITAGHSEQRVMNGYLPAVRYDYYTVLELNQAANLLDAKSWKKVFYTQADDEKMKGKANG